MILLTGSSGLRTLRGMGGRSLVYAGGGIWYLLRFALVALLVLRLVDDDPLFHLDLLWVGAPGLLLAAIFAGSGFVAGGERYYLPLLRIGALLAAASDAIVVLTGSYAPVAVRAGGVESELSRLVFVIVYGALAVDLLIFAALVSYRPMDPSRSPDTDEHLPEYESTRVEDE